MREINALKTITIRKVALLSLLTLCLWGCAPTTSTPTSAVTPINNKINTIYMAGDSTMSIKDTKDWPETGWGVPFAIFFDENLQVDNRAMNGRSTRTFIEEGRWQAIVDVLRTGDYVFIQFGHNDESKTKADRYTTPAQYQENLIRFIRETRAHGAEPILLSPITRRSFIDPDTNSNQGTDTLSRPAQIAETHAIYGPLSRQVAEAEGVTFVDMDSLTRAHFQAQGVEGSRLRFMHIAPNLHPNYPKGVSDNTHLNQLGAREVAQLVLTELKRQQHPLAQRLCTPDPKHLQLQYQPQK